MRRIVIVGFALMAGLGVFNHSAWPDAAAQEKCPITRVGVARAEADAGTTPELWAVIIGVSNYQFGDSRAGKWQISNLSYATDDAEAVSDFLRSDRGGAFPADHIKLLEDEGATRAKVLAALEWLKQAKRNDYFVIFIAAHGTVDAQAGGGASARLPYFVFYDTDPRDLAHTGLDMRVFRQMVEQDFPAKGLVLADTCHSAGMLLYDRPDAVAAGKELLVAANMDLTAQMGKIPKSIGYISAAYQTEGSIEKDELYHGVFTYCLLEALGGEADADHDGIVTFDEVVHYLFEEVPRQTGGQQHIAPATNNIDANCLPLAVTRYVGTGSNYGTLVLRNPDLDGVTFKLDGGPDESLRRGVETTLKLSDGRHKVFFLKEGTANGASAVTVARGQTSELKVEFSFAQDDEPPTAEPGRPATVHLAEATPPSANAKDLYLEAMKHFDKQEFKQAVEQFDRAISAADKGAYQQAFLYRGRALQALGRQDEAVASFEKALKLRPSDYVAETLLAEVAFDAAKLKPNNDEELKAIANKLKKIIRRDRRYDFARVVLADLLFLRGNLPGAESELRHALDINSELPPTHMILADVLSYHPLSGKRDEAIDHAEKAVELFKQLSTKKITFKRGSVSHLIFGGARYVNQAAKAEVYYILAKAITNAADLSPASYRDKLPHARESIDTAMKTAESIHDTFRLALVLQVSAQNFMQAGDAAGAIRDGERGLKVAQALNNSVLMGVLHSVLSQAYERSQNYCEAARHQQGFIQGYGSKLTAEGRAQAQARLRNLSDQAEAHRQKCGK